MAIFYPPPYVFYGPKGLGIGTVRGGGFGPGDLGNGGPGVTNVYGPGDSGSASEGSGQETVVAAIGAYDLGSGVELAAGVATVTGPPGDSGTGTDAAASLPAFFQGDAAAAADGAAPNLLASIAGPDNGAAADGAGVYLVVAAAGPDAGSWADGTAAITATVGRGPGDSGTASDPAAVAASLTTPADAAAGTEGATSLPSFATADSAAWTDGTAGTSGTVGAADAGSAGDPGSVTAAITAPGDSGIGAEFATVSIIIAPTTTVVDSDAFTYADGPAPVLSAGIAAADLPAWMDGPAGTTAAAGSSDAFTAGDPGSVAAVLTGPPGDLAGWSESAVASVVTVATTTVYGSDGFTWSEGGPGVPPVSLTGTLFEDFAGGSIRKVSDGSVDLWSVYGGENSDQVGSLDTATPAFKDVVGPSTADSYCYIQFFPNNTVSTGYNYPDGYASRYIKAGTGAWSANFNVCRLWVKVDASFAARGDGGDTIQVGTYIRDKSATDNAFQGQHYYHLFSPNIYPGRWLLFSWNRNPQHRVGQNPNLNWPEDPELANQGAHYFDNLTRWYFDNVGLQGASTWRLTDVFLDTDTAEPIATVQGSVDPSPVLMHLVSSVCCTYNGTAYELSWASPKNLSQSYTVRYSSASMKANGFASGTWDGTTISNPASAYQICHWTGPAMAESSELYLAIRPVGQTNFTEIRMVKHPDTAGSLPAPPSASVAASIAANDRPAWTDTASILAALVPVDAGDRASWSEYATATDVTALGATVREWDLWAMAESAVVRAYQFRVAFGAAGLNTLMGSGDLDVFKRAVAVPAFPVGRFVSVADGSEVTTGTVIATYSKDGVDGTIAAAPAYHAAAQEWRVDLAAGEMDGSIVGLSFSLSGCLPIHFTIKTVATLPSDLPTAAAIDTQLTGTHGTGSWQTGSGGSSFAGSGSVTVTESYGGTDNLRVTDLSGAPLAGATVTAYTAADYAAENVAAGFVKGQTSTKADGRWTVPLRLDPGSYQMVVSHGGYEVAVVPVTVT